MRGPAAPRGRAEPRGRGGQESGPRAPAAAHRRGGAAALGQSGAGAPGETGRKCVLLVVLSGVEGSGVYKFNVFFGHMCVFSLGLSMVSRELQKTVVS